MHAKIIPTRRPYRTVRSTSLVLWRALTAPPLLFFTLSENRKMLRNRDSFSLLSDTKNFVWRRRNMTSYDVNACERQYFFTTLTRSNSSSALITWPIGKPKSAPESAHFFLNSQLRKFCVTTFQNGGRRRYRRRTPFSKMNKTFSNHTVAFCLRFWGLDIGFQVCPSTLTWSQISKRYGFVQKWRFSHFFAIFLTERSTRFTVSPTNTILQPDTPNMPLIMMVW